MHKQVLKVVELLRLYCYSNVTVRNKDNLKEVLCFMCEKTINLLSYAKDFI